MRRYYALISMRTKAVRQLLWAVGIVIILVCTSTAVYAQAVPVPGTRGRTDPVQRELQRRVESKAIERALGASPRRRAEREQRLLISQIREDFLRIQIVDDDLQRSVSSRAPLDLKVVARFASEITKRSERLKDNLALPQVEEIPALPEPQGETGMEQLRASLSLMSNLIQVFVENPFFEKYKVVDAKLSAQARRDLEQIIKVSKQVKRRSEELGRARAGS